jgi:primosomal protein N' (replication factor Y)
VTNYYSVALPVPLKEPLTYQSQNPNIPIGSIVYVPFGHRHIWGLLWKRSAPPREAKLIEAVHNSAFLSEQEVLFLEKAWHYTLMPLGSLIRLVLPNLNYQFMPPVLYAATGKLPKKGGPDLGTKEQWAALTQSQEKTISGWIEKGLLEQRASLLKPLLKRRRPLVLAPDQQHIVDEFQKTRPYLIHGVTGSGKTEISLKCAEGIWEKGQQVLILVPEITLCPLWEKRIQDYFDVPIALWHSGLSSAQRQRFFENLTQGFASVIVGARSALFLPYHNLGLIILDEEHDPSYKQEERACYHARDMAVLRAHCAGCPLMLLSATPSMESLWNAEKKTYQQGRLLQRYHHASVIPSPTFIDMRPYPASEPLSPPLKTLLKETLEKKQQSLLFLNRRGYAPLLLCYTCGHRESCPHCSVCLTVHKKKKLLCHYCAFEIPIPTQCPHCHQATFLMPGLGIEKLYEEVLSFLPEARCALISSDTSAAEMVSLLSAIEKREIDILIGTQLISKGHHFPSLTTVGIVDTDFALSDLDLRAQERLFQVLSQVIGRAGREDKAGTVLIQTVQPEHPFFQHLKQPEGFALEEMERRRSLDFPPFSRFAALILSGLQEQEVQRAAEALRKRVPRYQGLEILGPTPAPLNPLRKHFRWRFLARAVRSFPLQRVLTQWRDCGAVPKHISCHIDIDPYSFL